VPGRGGGLRQAIAFRLAARRGDHPIVIPVAGGVGGLLSRRDCRRLASLVDPAAVDPQRSGPRGWLERRQARRSALLLVPDRATAMRLAARWHVDLARVNLAPDLGNPPRELIDRVCGPGGGTARTAKPWYAQ
jgi:hypothetical protein